MAQNRPMKLPPSLIGTIRFSMVVFGLLLVWPRPAAAQVSEPDGTTLPQPTGAAELAVVTSRGFLADADTLAGLFMYRGETIDPVADAHLTPGTFSPQCGFTGQIVLHGGGCQNGLGWYNATTPPTTPAQIYPLVPANLQTAPPTGLGCADSDFCPLATHTTTQAPQHAWTDVTYSADNIRTDPNYAGGPVGFALMAGTGMCTQTKYSESALGVVSTQYAPKTWITALVWQSTVDPNAYYIGFEDLPMTAATWKGANNGNDGDFNDFVFYVTGLDCQGGGEACETPLPGICANGTTQCSNGGMTINCVSNTPARTEVCNGLDDDCDGTIDNPGAPGLCPGTEVCSQGVCVPPCTDSEFPCPLQDECDTTDQLCKERACVGVSCPSGEVCHGGQCVGGCDGVTCPVNQVCRIGNCVNPCSGIACDTSQVCENGACVSPCSCRACEAGQTCTAAGTCVAQGCDKVTCNPPATVCANGVCQDGCQGVTCPTGQTCSGGECSVPDGGIPPGQQPDAGALITGSAGTSGTGAGTGGSRATTGTGGTASGSGGSSGDTSGTHEGGVTSCSCDAAEGPGATGLGFLIGVLALAFSRRRAPRAARARQR
jgi:MYXO-CTERM domain-containing protein